MANIQIADINPSESELLYELTNAEILDINGGGWFTRWFRRIVGVAMIIAGALTTPVGIGAALISGGSVIIAGEE